MNRFDAMSTINVEFYGIPRKRAGVEQAAIELHSEQVSLKEIFHELAVQFPNFGKECMNGNSLGAGLTANLNGERFVVDPTTVIDDGSTVLIMSSDAGG